MMMTATTSHHAATMVQQAAKQVPLLAWLGREEEAGSEERGSSGDPDAR